MTASNPRPDAYKATALPTELIRHTIVRLRGFFVVAHIILLTALGGKIFKHVRPPTRAGPTIHYGLVAGVGLEPTTFDL